MKWSEWADERLDDLERRQLDRHIRDFTGNSVVVRDENGRELISFASNDYFGLTTHPAVTRAASEAALEHGSGSGSARLIAGSRPLHSQLERELAAWKGEEAALLFSSGYAANVGVLTAFGIDGVTIFSDELNHASIVDGCRLARAGVHIYPHGDVDTLRAGLSEAERAIVVTDLVFSMDGDIAPIDQIAELCAETGALLVVDEAHAALGPHPDLTGVEHVRVGTLSKMLGSVGGFAASSETMTRLLVNAARSFVFTTAGSPGDAAAALAALRLLQTDEGERLRSRLRASIAALEPGREIPIVTVPLGSEDAALDAARRLWDDGLLVPAIRPPTVRSGTSRLRIALSAAHEPEHIERLLASLRDMDPDRWRR